MQKIVKRSAEKCESLHFYKYLCQKIGSEEVVKSRRLSLCIANISFCSDKISFFSGSKGEGLDMKGSDLDIMVIDSVFKVYESDTEAKRGGSQIPLIMHTEETQPCYTQLGLLDDFQSYQYINILHKNHYGYMLSSEQYKLFHLSKLSSLLGEDVKWQIHGPCIADTYEKMDLAICLKCEQWIVKAQPWVYRQRTAWPSPEMISNIISFGVLFVPIGCKGSVNENLEWRISFSVAEKFLIFSFRHTQLLCYALLKILLKEIVEKCADLKDLLCSYFLKTLLFWISEETDPNLWRPDTIIPCYMACLKRLLYCVRYSILPHYFIPDNNLFYSRFNVNNKEKLENILRKLYQQGAHNFVPSETLADYHRQLFNFTKSLSNKNVISIIQNSPSVYMYKHKQIENILYHCLHLSTTNVSRGMCAFYLSKASRFASDALEYLYISDNKHQYYKYKYNLSHLLISLHSDAVSGWLKLASLFYVHKNYFASLRVIDYALQKYTDEKIFIGLVIPELCYCLQEEYLMDLMTKEYTSIQKQELIQMKNENLYTVLKTLTIDALRFNSFSIPQELQLHVNAIYHPLLFAYFLSVLCHYHLQDNTACRHYLQQLTSLITNSSTHYTDFPTTSSAIMFGIAHKLIGETYIARQIFQQIVEQVPSLSWLSIYS